MRTIILGILLSFTACHGSCERDTASRAAIDPAAICDEQGRLCYHAGKIYACTHVGHATYDATCAVLTLPTAEAR